MLSKENHLKDAKHNLINEFKNYLQDEQLASETIKTYVSVLKQFYQDVKKDSDNITVDDVRAFRTYCRNREFKKSSLVNKYAGIRKYCEFLCEVKKTLSSSDYKKIKKLLRTPQINDKIVKPLTETQVEKVFQIAKQRNPRDYAIFLVMYEGCLRRKETLNLKLFDVDLANKQVKITGIKREDDRLINISNRCTNALREYIEKHRGEPYEQYKEYLFLNYGWRLEKNKLFTLNKEYKLLANLPEDFTLHGWRHTGCTHITKKALKQSKNNIPLTLKHLMKQTGHKSPEILLNKYVHVAQEETKEFYNNIWNNNNESYIEPQQHKPEPKQPKPQDTYIADNNTNIQIKELELKLELLKLKQEKQSRDNMSIYG